MFNSQLVHNKYDEVGVVFFGTTETENHLTDAELEGYENVVVARPLSVVNDGLAETVKELPRGFGNSDLISAIVLGIDMIVNNTGPASKNKRIFLITDGETLVKEPTEGTKKDQVITLADQMQQKGLSLDAVVIRTKDSSKSLLSAASRENEVLLQTFASRTKGDIILADSYTSLLGSVRTRSVSPTTLYRGELELTPKMAVKEPLEFNSFLEEVAQRCQGKRLHDFWELVVSKSLSLITRDEAPDSGVTQEEAASFLSGDASRGKVSEAPEEEIDEMDAILDEIE